LGLDLIFPLTFIAFTVPMLRDRVNLVVALLAAIVAVATALVLPGSWYVLTAGILASAVGAWLARRQQLAQMEPIHENS
jgi:predicted branched-subunit amino acid permease